MSFRKFGPNDIYINTMKAHPNVEFFIYSGSVYYNNMPFRSLALMGSSREWTASPSTPAGPYNNIYGVGTGFISLYEYNINRSSGSMDVDEYGSRTRGASYPSVGSDWWVNPLIYPYISKDSARASFKTAGPMELDTYETEFKYGDVLKGVYPQYATITREWITTPSSSNPLNHNMHFFSLKNTLDLYGTLSPHYLVSGPYGDKNKQKLNLIHIPSIFYGTQIKPGTVSLKFWITGTLAGELQDSKENGELIQVGPAGSTGSGSVGGVVLYNEGFLLLTGSWDLNGDTYSFKPSEKKPPQWKYWGAGCYDGLNFVVPTDASREAASFGLNFQGLTETQTLTMYAHAKKGQVNFSNNPTFLMSGSEQLEYTSSHVYEENSSRLMVNTVSSSYSDHSASFKRQVYISKVGIYDNQNNLLGVATLSSPVLKRENEDLSFKIKLDI